MAQPFAGQTQLAATGVSSALMLDPTARVTQAMVTVPSSVAGQGTANLQMTLDTWSPTVTQVWAQVSSITITSAAYFDGAVAGLGGGGVSYTFLTPVAGLRLVSSNFNSTGAYVLKVLQEIMG